MGAGRFPRGVRGCDRRVTLVTLAVVSILVAAVYLPVHGHGFSVLDDHGYVRDNPLVTGGISWSSLSAALTSVDRSNWHPLTWVSHMLDVEVFGLDPGAHHLVSVGLHALAAALLGLALALMTGRYLLSALLALAWAVHPVRVESVAWIAERKDVLAMAWMGLLLLAYLRFLARPSPLRLAAALGAYAGGLMSKPVLVTMPLLLLVIDFWPLGRFLRGRTGAIRVIAEKIPFIVLAAASSVLTLLAQGRGGAVIAVTDLPLHFRLLNAVDSYARYLGMIFWPRNLVLFYPHPEESILAWRVAWVSLLLAGISILVWRLARRYPWLAAGWAWYFVSLAPMIGLVQVGAQARADRYLSVPLVGILVIVIWSLDRLPRGSGRVSWPLRAAAILLVAALAVATRRQISTWRDDVTLFGRAVALTAGNGHAHFCLALAAIERDDWAMAERELRSTVDILPRHSPARRLLAGILERNGRPSEAADQMIEALRGAPADPVAEADLGLLLAQLGRRDEAVEHLLKWVGQDDGQPMVRQRLVRLLLELGRPTEAGEYLASLLAAQPENRLYQRLAEEVTAARSWGNDPTTRTP